MHSDHQMHVKTVQACITLLTSMYIYPQLGPTFMSTACTSAVVHCTGSQSGVQCLAC